MNTIKYFLPLLLSICFLFLNPKSNRIKVPPFLPNIKIKATKIALKYAQTFLSNGHLNAANVQNSIKKQQTFILYFPH